MKFDIMKTVGFFGGILVTAGAIDSVKPHPYLLLLGLLLFGIGCVCPTGEEMKPVVKMPLFGKLLAEEPGWIGKDDWPKVK